MTPQRAGGPRCRAPGKVPGTLDTLHHELPEWAPRVPQAKVRRLYEDDAAGLHDEELLDDVGYSLLARCEAFVAAVGAVQGRAPCPRCGQIVAHGHRRDEILRCPCGWTLPWSQYFATIQHQQLSGAEPVLAQFRHYVETFPACVTPRAKMLAIDALIHGFHRSLSGDPTRPVAVNLLEGRLHEVIAFLDALHHRP